jgi:hypothetical protein
MSLHRNFVVEIRGRKAANCVDIIPISMLRAPCAQAARNGFMACNISKQSQDLLDFVI